jgi:hypothetical protein
MCTVSCQLIKQTSSRQNISKEHNNVKIKCFLANNVLETDQWEHSMFRSKSHYIIIYRLPLPSALCSNTKNTCHRVCTQTLANNTTESNSCSTTGHLMGDLKFSQQCRWRFTSSGMWSAVTLGEWLLMFASTALPSPSNAKHSCACPLTMEAI